MSMAEVYGYGRMLSTDDDDSSAKCRERRRRRIEMRRLSSIPSTGSSISENINPREKLMDRASVAEGKRVREEDESDAHSASASPGEDAAGTSTAVANIIGGTDSMVVFGTMSMAGRSREMEDTIYVRTNLCRPELTDRRPVHFFGVYDGHGGAHVALLCRDRMHVLLEDELMRPESGIEVYSASAGGSSSKEEEKPGWGEAEAENWWRRAVERCFQRIDEVALSTCACGSVEYQCGCHPMDTALAGSTAVVAILAPDYIVVGNCGDSRAVLCRGGRAIPLSFDHKPDRRDERERIQASGGRVIFLDGARVEGILAMSRAIGDKYLKPYVTAKPDVTFTRRDPEDECLILASDGLWDVLSSELACEVAGECLRETGTSDSSGDGAIYPSRSASAAALLTRLALGRKSSDNISVIVVDLKRN